MSESVDALHASGIPAGFSALTLNGISLDSSDLDIFDIHAIAVKEAAYIALLDKMGLDHSQVVNLLQPPSNLCLGCSSLSNLTQWPLQVMAARLPQLLCLLGLPITTASDWIPGTMSSYG